MNANAISKKIDQLTQHSKDLSEKLDRFEVWLKTAIIKHDQRPRWKRFSVKLIEIIGIVSAVVGLFSLFPNVTISDPAQMGNDDIFSYSMNVSNAGILPIYRVRWQLAPRHLKVANTNPPRAVIRDLLPERGQLLVSQSAVDSASKPGARRSAGIMVYPGGEAIVEGDPTYRFRVYDGNNKLGTLMPGEQSTITTLGLISAPQGASYDDADFAIAIQYLPLIPIPMQTCFRFNVFTDRTGTQHWFRLPNTCDRFPWLHPLPPYSESSDSRLEK